MKFLVLIFSIFLINLTVQQNLNDNAIFEWHNFKLKYNKIYKNKNEEAKRFEIFINNLNEIKSNNELFKKRKSSFEMEVNVFTDLNDDEIVMEDQNNLQGFLSRSRNLENYVSDGTKLPFEVDWRITGVLSEVKDQGSCGSCWAFSTAGAIEGHMNIYQRKAVNISTQNLVDCVKLNKGCRGGFMTPAYDYILKYGVNSEQYYPYKKRSGICRQVFSKNVATINSYYNIKQNDEDALQHAIATKGPVSVGIMSERKLILYKKGIYFSSTCRNGINNLNHAVLVVGYGTENESDYWIIKNSWGKKWGENGYAKIARNRNNHCGLATIASFPVVDLPKETITFWNTLNDIGAKILIFFGIA